MQQIILTVYLGLVSCLRHIHPRHSCCHSKIQHLSSPPGNSAYFVANPPEYLFEIVNDAEYLRMRKHFINRKIESKICSQISSLVSFFHRYSCLMRKFPVILVEKGSQQKVHSPMHLLLIGRQILVKVHSSFQLQNNWSSERGKIRYMTACRWPQATQHY